MTEASSVDPAASAVECARDGTPLRDPARPVPKYRPLTAIHIPIPEYDDSIARRVQRLFDGVQPGRPLMRINRLWHDNPALFQPGPRRDNSDRGHPAAAPYLRSERQCLVRLPVSRAVVFSIHTFVVPRAAAGFSAAPTR